MMISIVIGVGILISIFCTPASAVPTRSDYCMTKECLQSASSLMWSMNKTVDPCDDFYKFACGTPNSFTYGYKDGFAELQVPMKHMVHNFIKKTVSPTDPEPVRMVRIFYSTCVRDDPLSTFTLSRHLSKAGLPMVPSFLKGTELATFDWMDASVRLKKMFDVDLFIRWDIDENVFGAGHVLYLHALRSARIGNPLWESSLFESLARMRRQSAIKEIIEAVLEDTGIFLPERRLSQAVNILYEMIHNSPIVVKSNEETALLDFMKKIRKTTLGNLQNLTDLTYNTNGIGGQIESQRWKSWIEKLVLGITGKEVKVDDQQEVYYLKSSLSHLTKVHSYLSKKSPAELELYAWFQVVTGILKHVAKGDDENAAKCTKLTEEHLNTALGFGIIPAEFITETKPEVIEILEYLKQTLAEHIRNSSWMEDSAKHLATKKIKSLKYAIGAPDWIKNETAVLQTYENIKISSLSHLENMLSITQASVKSTFNQFINGYDENYNRESNVKISSMTTYYSVLQNFISIPWAMLHSPVYHLGLKSLNYGALGTVIGHELSHGFDDDGIHFDQNANFNRRSWNTTYTKKYKENTDCFVKQYGNFNVSVVGLAIKVDSNKTLNENIADNVGAKIAFYAMQKALKRKTEQKLPGFLDYSSEKLFFLSNAHIWCGEGELENFIKYKLNADEEHSPRSHRVNGPMQNMEEFAKAFNCPLGSNMNPDKPKCRIWK